MMDGTSIAALLTAITALAAAFRGNIADFFRWLSLRDAKRYNALHHRELGTLEERLRTVERRADDCDERSVLKESEAERNLQTAKQEADELREQSDERIKATEKMARHLEIEVVELRTHRVDLEKRLSEFVRGYTPKPEHVVPPLSEDERARYDRAILERNGDRR